VSSERATTRSSSSARARFGALPLLVAALLLPAAADAHGGDLAGFDGAVDARLDPLAPELAGVRVQLHRTAANQLVIENRTERTLELLDEHGVAFVRIGPGGVEGNLASPAWYQGFAPEGGRVPPELLERARKGEPLAARWALARREPTWGWFDARLQVEPNGHAPKPGAATPARWEIPVRIGGEPSALRGRFVPRPKPVGMLHARLVTAGELAPGVRISLLDGRAAAFFLESASEELVTVLGRDGEPFLRVGRFGVEANLHSATFAEVARLRGGTGLLLEPRADAEPRWQRVSSAPRYAWVDLRTAYADGEVPEAVVKGGVAVELLRWVVPVRIGTGEDASLVRVEGRTVWEPFHVDRPQRSR
jgi:hypothetical protein